MWHKPHVLNAIADVLFVAAAAVLLTTAVLWLVRVPALPIRQVQVQEELRQVRRAEVEQALAGMLRGNFFSVNVDAVRKSLEKLPWVRKVEVRRQWPARLLISIEEHRPVARWEESRASGRNEMVNTHGEVFAANLPDKEAAVLPRMYGPSGTSAEVLKRFGEFAQLLAPLQLQPAQITLSSRLAWQLRTADGMLIDLGREQTKSPIGVRLARFVEVYPATVGKRPQRPAAVDLRYPNGFALRGG